MDELGPVLEFLQQHFPAAAEVVLTQLNAQAAEAGDGTIAGQHATEQKDSPSEAGESSTSLRAHSPQEAPSRCVARTRLIWASWPRLQALYSDFPILAACLHDRDGDAGQEQSSDTPLLRWQSADAVLTRRLSGALRCDHSRRPAVVTYSAVPPRCSHAVLIGASAAGRVRRVPSRARRTTPASAAPPPPPTQRLVAPL